MVSNILKRANLNRPAIRLLYYLLILSASAGFYIYGALTKAFNQDEFQHTYLAWASVNFNYLVYKDIFDNHGPIYTLANALFLYLFQPKAGLEALYALRFFNLILLALNFISCFEIIYYLTKKASATILAPFLLICSYLFFITIQIRPDQLQGLFLNLGLLAFFYAYQSKRSILAIVSGFFFTLMLLTNLKSASGLIGLLAGITIIYFKFKDQKKIAKLLQNFLLGLSLTFLTVLLIMYCIGNLKGYLQSNLIFNFLLAFSPEKERSWEFTYQILFKYDWLICGSLLGSLFIWGLTCKKKDTLNRENRFLLLSTIIGLLLGKIFGLWLQYDLIFMVLLSTLASWVAWSCIDCILQKINTPYLPHNTLQIFSTLLCLVVISYFSWRHLINFQNPNKQYFKYLEDNYQRINYDNQADYTVEEFTNPCPGFGFVRSASPMIINYQPAMRIYEEITNQDIYSQNSYPQLLNKQKVKYLLIGNDIFRIFKGKTLGFIYKNYQREKCYWKRTTPFS